MSLPILLISVLWSQPPASASTAQARLEGIDVAPVWAGHPVGFSIRTAGGFQYVGFYDPERRMTIGQRRLDSTDWRFRTLPSRVRWDSHNGIVLEIDRHGHIHVSGNMHGNRLVYFRSNDPHDISGFERLKMIGSREKEVTYPQFLSGHDETLYFLYRDGRSGAGARILNRYDEETRSWSRLLSQPLFDGDGQMSAYLHGPSGGPDGYFHLVWMWRDTPVGSTNHDLSYARTRDFVRWENIEGEALSLPLRPQTPGVVVDAVRVGEGLAGVAFGLGWDVNDRPVVNYCKYGPDGYSQMFNARWESGGWRISQTSDWTYRWDLEHTGAGAWDISANPVAKDAQGRLTQAFEHIEAGRGIWILDDETLRPVALGDEPAFLQELQQVESAFPGIEMRPLTFDRQGKYFLRWETLPLNRDQRRQPPFPPPSMLRVYQWPAPAGDSTEEAALQPRRPPQEVNSAPRPKG
jgi:hypothetical protein